MKKELFLLLFLMPLASYASPDIDVLLDMTRQLERTPNPSQRMLERYQSQLSHVQRLIGNLDNGLVSRYTTVARMETIGRVEDARVLESQVSELVWPRDLAKQALEGAKEKLAGKNPTLEFPKVSDIPQPKNLTFRETIKNMRAKLIETQARFDNYERSVDKPPNPNAKWNADYLADWAGARYGTLDYRDKTMAGQASRVPSSFTIPQSGDFQYAGGLSGVAIH